MFDEFWGNSAVTTAIERMIEQDRIPQTLLWAGQEGVGKATLARRFAARLLGGAQKIEKDDLSVPENLAIVAGREKWPAEKRNEDPLLFASHPDFVTFAPDGPLRQLSISQMRRLKEIAQYKPSRGSRRVFLIDHVDRAGEQAENSLLKILEEPPEHLILIMTAENAYDLLPTIRSRAAPFHFNPLSSGDMAKFAKARGVEQRRIDLAGGSPGVAVSLDLALYERRRAAMFSLLRVAAGLDPFGAWLKHSEAIGRSRSEKLEPYLKALYTLLRDVMLLTESAGAIQNSDLRRELEPVARAVSGAWIRSAVKKVDELVELLRRNIQKTIALDALILELRAEIKPASARA